MSSTGVLRIVAEWLGGTHDRRDRVARGLRDGIPTTVRFALRGTGYERTSYERRLTEIDVHMPSGYPLSLHVRRHEWTDTHQIERSAMVDQWQPPASERSVSHAGRTAWLASCGHYLGR
jgi:hypothetical protein